MTIICDNIIFALQKTGGVSRFWSKLVAHRATIGDTLFIDPAGTDNLYRQSLTLVPTIRDHRLPLRMGRYVDFHRRFLPGRYIFHSSYYRSNRNPQAINVATVHDMIYEKFERGPARWIHIRQKTAALRQADCIVCVSDATRRDLLVHYPFCGSKRIEVIPNGVDRADTSRVRASPTGLGSTGPGDRYMLYVGHRGACKGFDRVYDVLTSIPEDLCCIVVGAPFDADESAAIARHGLQDRIRHAGRVTDAELADLYAGAAFFFFPSLYEGFGIPPVEAMAWGCPVVATDRSSVPEVVGDAALLFDPDDRPGMVAAVSSLLSDGDRAADLRRRGMLRAAALDWRHAIARYDALYTDLLSVR